MDARFHPFMPALGFTWPGLMTQLFSDLNWQKTFHLQFFLHLVVWLLLVWSSELIPWGWEGQERKGSSSCCGAQGWSSISTLSSHQPGHEGSHSASSCHRHFSNSITSLPCRASSERGHTTFLSDQSNPNNQLHLLSKLFTLSHCAGVIKNEHGAGLVIYPPPLALKEN